LQVQLLISFPLGNTAKALVIEGMQPGRVGGSTTIKMRRLASQPQGE
jgi:hypothetical protein